MPDDDAPPPEFVKETLDLPVSHQWTCKPGNNVFVADRGAVAFEIPQGWHVQMSKKDTLTIHDKPPPDDVARITLTIFRLPPVKGGWGGLPVLKLINQTFEEEARDAAKKDKAKGGKGRIWRPQIIESPREDIEMAWAEKRPWKDPETGRMIRCRQMFARARLVQVLLTFDVYQDLEQQNYDPVWADLLETIQLGVRRDITGQNVN